ncbi:MAG: HAD family hydrolase [Deltaproteobacteria bacterium]|nr:HAD family hydrolase [Deltaproteobacteria bacterium]
MLSARPTGPSGGRVPCSGCGATLDPLRAGHVAIFHSRFHYFCSFEGCRRRYVDRLAAEWAAGSGGAVPDEQGGLPAGAGALSAAALVLPAGVVPAALAVVSARPSSDESAELVEPVADEEPVVPGARAAEPDAREAEVLLLALSLIAGALALALELAGPARLVLVARVVLLAAGSAALVGRAVTSPTDPREPHRATTFLAPALATAVAAWALAAEPVATAARAAFLGAVVLCVATLGTWLVGVAARPVSAHRAWLARMLDAVARRVAAASGAAGARVRASDLRPGEHVVVEAGEPVPVDVEVLGADVEVVPWPEATARTRLRRGQVAVAGAQVTQGQLRGACLYCGDDRALCRSMLSSERRCDVHAAAARFGRAVAERYAPALAALAAVAAAAVGGGGPIHAAMVAVAVLAAVGSPAVGAMAGLCIARRAGAALARGVVYADGRAWDRAARVGAAVFCARGTLVLGEPELAELELFSEQACSRELLELAAGALAGERSPRAVAVLRAAQERGLEPVAVRNPRLFPGRGATGVASTGEALCVGSRDLLIEQGLSAAVAERRAYELESRGRTVLFVAKASRLVGIIALHDGLRPGARAAVQHLLDAKIEPVLMSADARETCAALGRSLDIEHLRPGVLAHEAADTVDRIRGSGVSVAVFGHPGQDDQALVAADVSVALGAARSAPGEHAVTLVGNDVRDAGLALLLARRGRAQALQLLALVLVPALLGSLVVAAGLLAPEYAPLCLLVGTLVAFAQLRAADRAQAAGGVARAGAAIDGSGPLG